MIKLSNEGTQASHPLYKKSTEEPTALDELTEKIRLQFERALENASDYSVSMGYNGIVAYATENPSGGLLCFRPYKVELLLNEKHERISLGLITPFHGTHEDLEAIADHNLLSDFTPVFSMHYEDLSNRIFDSDSGSCVIC